MLNTEPTFSLCVYCGSRPGNDARYLDAATAVGQMDASVRSRMEETTRKTLELFAIGGFESLGKFIESTIPEAEREKAADVFIKILEGAGWEAWKIARASAGQPPLEMNGARARLLRDTLNATSDSLHYGAPVYLQLNGFEEVRATEIGRAHV